MRVIIKPLHPDGDVREGEFLGITSTEHDDCMAVVRVDGCGLCLTLVHPSRVEPANQGRSI